MYVINNVIYQHIDLVKSIKTALLSCLSETQILQVYLLLEKAIELNLKIRKYKNTRHK